jgi:hypothetical protein
MLARLRSTTIALLGVVTAVGLALIAFIAQLGFPGAFNGSIPDGPGGSGAVHGAIALAQGVEVGRQERQFRGHRVNAQIRSSSPVRSGVPAGTDLGSSKQVGQEPSGNPPSASPHPPSIPTSEPPGEPEPASPAPTEITGAPETNSPASSKKTSAVKSSPEAKGHSHGKTKGKPDASSSEGSQSHHSGKEKQHSGASSKPTGHSPGKPEKPDKPGKPDKSATSPSKPTNAPPPPEPVETKLPEAGGKETGNPGKAGKHHH